MTNSTADYGFGLHLLTLLSAVWYVIIIICNGNEHIPAIIPVASALFVVTLVFVGPVLYGLVNHVWAHRLLLLNNNIHDNSNSSSNSDNENEKAKQQQQKQEIDIGVMNNRQQQWVTATAAST